MNLFYKEFYASQNIHELPLKNPDYLQLIGLIKPLETFSSNLRAITENYLQQ